MVYTNYKEKQLNLSRILILIKNPVFSPDFLDYKRFHLYNEFDIGIDHYHIIGLYLVNDKNA